MAGALKLQRVLVAAGFVLVAVGNGLQYWGVSYGAPVSYVWSSEVFGTASTVAYGLLAWATWSWFASLGRTPSPGLGLTKVLRLLGAANLAFAIGMLAVTYDLAHQAIIQPYEGRVSTGVAVTSGVRLLGFCLVSFAFWSAAPKVRARADSSPGSGSVDEVTIGTHA